MSVDDLAIESQNVEGIETIYKVCEHLAANGRMQKNAGNGVFNAEYQLPSSGGEAGFEDF